MFFILVLVQHLTTKLTLFSFIYMCAYVEIVLLWDVPQHVHYPLHHQYLSSLQL